jgi:hypothetical protein
MNDIDTIATTVFYFARDGQLKKLQVSLHMHVNAAPPQIDFGRNGKNELGQDE